MSSCPITPDTNGMIQFNFLSTSFYMRFLTTFDHACFYENDDNLIFKIISSVEILRRIRSSSWLLSSSGILLLQVLAWLSMLFLCLLYIVLLSQNEMNNENCVLCCFGPSHLGKLNVWVHNNMYKVPARDSCIRVE